MESGNAIETAEIRHAVLDAVNMHGSGQPCIVDLNSHDGVLHDQLAPLAINVLVFALDETSA